MANKPLPPYKDPAGNWRKSSIFKGAPGNLTKPCYVFTLWGDEPGLINAHTTFVAMMDPTGYEWAMKYLGSFQHWEALMKGGKWFRDWYNAVVAEIHAKLRADALINIQEVARGAASEAQRLAASKYLAERPYERVDKISKARGRPSKEELKGHLKQMADISEQTKEDYERIGLKVVK